MRIRSFKALRPVPAKVEKIAALPYDVVSTEEARQLAVGNPLSLLHITRAEIAFNPGHNPYADEVYAQAVNAWETLKSSGNLERESSPCLYLYQQQMGDHRQQGLVGLCHVDDYREDRIKKHEKTRADKENDRTRLTSAMSANAGPVFLTYRDDAGVSQAIAQAQEQNPLYDFVAPDGIRHTAWRVPAPDAVVQAMLYVPCFYIADGHHRAASAARVGLERRNANPNHRGDEDYNWFLSVMFPASQLRILPYNRLLQHFNGHSASDVMSALSKVGDVVDSGRDTPERTGEVCFYMGGKWRTLVFHPQEDLDPVGRLDVSRLQDLVLAPLFGVDDPRTAHHIDFVGGIRGNAYLKQQVDAGNASIAFSMYPVSVEELMDIADAGQIMPPKSTWFEPKLRSGLFLHTF